MYIFTFMHLADAFFQSDLQVHSGYTFIVSMCSLGIEPTTFELLTQCSTTEPQEHSNIYIKRAPIRIFEADHRKQYLPIQSPIRSFYHV